MPFLQVKTRKAWLEDAEAGCKVCESHSDMTLREVLVFTRANNIEDYNNLSAMLVAFEALGQPVSNEMKILAGIRNVEDVLNE